MRRSINLPCLNIHYSTATLTSVTNTTSLLFASLVLFSTHA